MFTRSTLTVITIAGLLSGCVRPNDRVATISSVDDNATQSAAAPSATSLSPAGNAEASGAAAFPETKADSANGSMPDSGKPVSDSAVSSSAAVSTGSDIAAASSAATSDAAKDSGVNAPSTPAASVQSNSAAATQTSAAATGEIIAGSPSQAPVQTVAGDTVQAASANEQSQIEVAHALTRSDDGSAVIVTVDGKEVGTLKRGQITSLSVAPGKHKLGGYVKTLFGLGKVTIPSVDFTTSAQKVTKISYKVTKNKPGFILADG